MRCVHIHTQTHTHAHTHTHTHTNTHTYTRTLIHIHIQAHHSKTRFKMRCIRLSKPPVNGLCKSFIFMSPAKWRMGDIIHSQVVSYGCVTHMNDSYVIFVSHKYEFIMSQIWCHLNALANGSCHICTTPHTWMGNVTNTISSCHIYDAILMHWRMGSVSYVRRHTWMGTVSYDKRRRRNLK